MRARKPWGPEEGPLGKPKPQSWFELTSALLDTLTFFLKSVPMLQIQALVLSLSISSLGVDR